MRLHRCPLTAIKLDGHGCWRVQRALDEQGIDYEVVKVPLLRPRRDEVERLTGQHVVPVIEFEDDSAYREESKAMAERLRSGRLFEEPSSG